MSRFPMQTHGKKQAPTQKLAKRRKPGSQANALRQPRFSSLENLENRTLLTVNGIEVDIAPVVDHAATVEVSRPLQHHDRIQRIVNGTQTSDYESVGIVNGQCSGTLIAPNAVLTAAHCIPDNAAEAQTFEVGGETYAVDRVAVHPNYGSQDIDLAVMVLKQNVVGIQPVDVNRVAPEVGQMLTLVGFGGTGTAQNGHNDDFGVKHEGQTPIDELTSTHVNWDFDHASEANTAPGDSGGPAFLNVGGKLVVAGVTSGGTQDNAALGDNSFDTRVDPFVAWIDDVVQGNITGTVTDGTPAQDGGQDGGQGDDFGGEVGDEFGDWEGEWDEFNDEWNEEEFLDGEGNGDESDVATWVLEELEDYDTDGNEMLSQQELVTEFLDLDLSRQEAGDEAEFLIVEFDVDDNQQLDFAELVQSYSGGLADEGEGGGWEFDESGYEIDDELLDDDFADESDGFDGIDWQQPTISGDIDGNGMVGFEDFLVVSVNFGETTSSVTDGDIDGNGIVGFSDFLSISQTFGEWANDGGAGEGDAERVHRIVNGTKTDGYQEVGLVNGQCTGTLIASNAVLTAAHCVESGMSPQEFEVAGQSYGTKQVYVHPDYQSQDIDLAVMVLTNHVNGIQPVDIGRVTPQVGQTLTLVGFGGTGTAQNGHNGDFGVKHVGQTPIDEVTATGVNWNYDNASEANTAPGDSGGPAFLNVNGSRVVAGVTSGGTQDNAGLGDYSFDTRVDTFANWIDGIVQGNGGTTPTPTPTPAPTPTPTDPPITTPDDSENDDEFDDQVGDDASEFEQYALDELDAYDTNGDGSMSRRELVNEFMDLGDSRRDAREFADYLLEEFDFDGDNKLNLGELAATYGGDTEDSSANEQDSSTDDWTDDWTDSSTDNGDWQDNNVDDVFAGWDSLLWW